MKERTNLIRLSFISPVFLLFLLLFHSGQQRLLHSSQGPEISSQGTAVEPSPEKIFYTFRIVDVYPHQADAFTQGLYSKTIFYMKGPDCKVNHLCVKWELETGAYCTGMTFRMHISGEGYHHISGYYHTVDLEVRKGYYLIIKMILTACGRIHISTEGWGITHNGKTPV
jgi:glutamine cyclotransferase